MYGPFKRLSVFVDIILVLGTRGQEEIKFKNAFYQYSGNYLIVEEIDQNTTIATHNVYWLDAVKRMVVDNRKN